MREDEFDRCVTVLKRRATLERIREREMRCEGRKAPGVAGTWLAMCGDRMEAMKKVKIFGWEKGLGRRAIQ